MFPELEKYFLDFEYPGRTNLPKADNIKLVVERNKLRNPVYVGDTAGDLQGSERSISTIYICKVWFWTG